jgi:LytR cell envelope-related transcriptional attenuator
MSDMTDPSGQMPRRSPRVSDGGAPVSGAVAIVLALVAVVAGFLILNSISDGGDAALDFPADGSAGANGADGPDSSDVTDSTNPGSTTTTTTVPQIVTEGADVIVANVNSVGGSAGQMKRALELAGFTVVAAVDGSAAVGDLEESVIYYDDTNPQALAVATSLGEVLGGVSSIAPLTGTPPTADGEMQGADVLLMLGDDKAGQSLEDLNPELNGSGDATQVTNPPIAGDAGSETDDTTG